MKPAEARLVRALDAADPAIRLYLLHGPDEAGARAFGERLGKALGADATRTDLTSAALKADPARLADEAAAFAMFGGRSWIRVDPLTDEALPAIQALLDLTEAGNPVVAIGPALRRDAKVVKAAEASAAAIVHACYVPEGRDADALAITLGREAGLDLGPDVARRLAAAAGGDRAILASEIGKYALYLDAEPGGRVPLDHEAIDALSASSEEGDLGRLAVAVFGGDTAAVDAELARLAGEGVEGIAMIRALKTRALLLVQLRAQMAAGEGIDRVMETGGRAIFWKEKDAVRRALGRWNPEGLATATVRLGEAERRMKAAGTIGTVLVEDTLLAIARHAARRG